MNYKKFGKTDFLISEIGFGTWGIGGEKPNLLSYGPKNDKDSENSLKRAFDLGVNFFDTANSYGTGHSETLLGKVFKSERSNIVIATKGGYLNTFTSNGKNQDFSPEAIEKSINESLDRLNTDYIDIFQIHDCPTNILINETNMLKDTFIFLKSLKEKKIIKSLGFAGKNPDDALFAIDNFDIQSIQANFNLTDMRIMDNGVLDKCINKNIAIIARTPLVFGFLSNKIDKFRKFQESDHRKRFHQNQIDKWILANELYKLPELNDLSSLERALVFCLSIDGISVVNTGMNTIEQVEQNLKSSHKSKLLKSTIQKIKELYNINYKNSKIEIK